MTPAGLPPDAPPGSRALPAELAVNPRHEQCVGTSRQEELDRYWGFGSGPLHYLGLPWRAVMNRDTVGFYVTLSPLLLVLPLLLLSPIFWGSKHAPLRLLFWGTLFSVFLWIISANGVPWYGIGMFLGFAVFVEALIVLAPTSLARTTSSVFITSALLLSLSFSLWQIDSQKSMYEYKWGKASADVIAAMNIPDYGDIAAHVTRLSENPDRPFLYRIGTFIPYFIPRNLVMIPQNDNQLGFFNCLNQEGDHQRTLHRLQALGFHSIIFDTNTATIEQDPNGTLHQKVERFLAFANDPAIDIVPVVNKPENGIIYLELP